MINISELSTWEGRRRLLEEFQFELVKRFGEDDYNIFVFGSYVRMDFAAGKSDIDLIVYCENPEKQMDIADFCTAFFKEKGLPADVLEYYYMENAYIYANGILNAIRLTDYYPKKLRAELFVIAKRYSQYLEGQRIKKKYMNWDYVMQKGKNDRGSMKNGRVAEEHRRTRV